MTANGWFQIAFFLLVILALTKPLGVFITKVFNREKTIFDFALRPLERLIYRLTGVQEEREMAWTEYTYAMLLFSGVSMVLLYLIERTQKWLPFNPQKLSNVEPGLAWGNAASFTTNTNWQAYVPETTMSYLTQMAGLAYHNFISAAVGIVLAIAVIRGIARRETDRLGNFWVDTTRCLLWVLLPFCLVGALVLVSQGVIQNLKPYTTVELIEPQTVQVTGADGKTSTQIVRQQIIAQGPVASQEVIKEFGTNGGGFFNTNSAHPFENPTPFTNFFELLLIFAIPSALTYTLGRMTGSQRHGWAVWAAMAFLFLVGVTATYWAEARGNPELSGVDQAASTLQPGGNMEGKEVRFGIANTALWAAGLMVGRTPEYLGKKIESYDVKMAMLAVLVLTFTILGFSAVAVVKPVGTAGISNPGPHGLSQILYAYVSSTGNNGSAFGGINANTLWYNTTTGVAQLLGRFFMIIPIMAIAGSLARKKTVPASAGTFPVTGALFTTLLVSTIVIVGALTFFPALSLGPILEHLLMMSGKLF